MAPVAFRVTVGPGTAAEKSKVLEAHQFADHSCCPFQEGKKDWDLLPTADMSKHFEIMVEVLHCLKGNIQNAWPAVAYLACSASFDFGSDV